MHGGLLDTILSVPPAYESLNGPSTPKGDYHLYYSREERSPPAGSRVVLGDGIDDSHGVHAVEVDGDGAAISVPTPHPQHSGRRRIFSAALLQWLRFGSQKESQEMVRKRAVVLQALSGPVVCPPMLARRPALPRSASFSSPSTRETAMTARYQAGISEKKRALAAAKVQAQQSSKISTLASLCLFLIILSLGYIMFRFVGCETLDWECLDKPFQGHWEDVTTMCAIGGVIFASGPTIVPGMIIPSITMFVGSMMAFGALGQSPYLLVSLGQAGAFKPPALYVYLLAILIVVMMLLYAFWASTSRYDTVVTLLVMACIIGLYSAAAIVALVGGLSNVSFHPHHYMMAWHISLLFRNRNDAPSVLIRWILTGVFVQGISAYSPASILDDGQPCSTS